MEREPRQSITIRPLLLDDSESLRRMHGEVWRATYPNKAAGVLEEWVEQETARWMTPEALERARSHFTNIIAHPDEHFFRVVEAGGEPKGFIHATHLGGKYNLTGLYVSPEYHGSGVADELMSEVDSWSRGREIDLEVVSYNARAIRFYEKHGFVMQNTDNELFKGMLPNRTMIRKAQEESHEI